MFSGGRPGHSPARSTRSKRACARQRSSSGSAANSVARLPSRPGVLRRPSRRRISRSLARGHCVLPEKGPLRPAGEGAASGGPAS
eukprot:10263467-Lingulodinium_polyedra.AAC.1